MTAVDAGEFVALNRRTDALERLVRWMALPFGENTPIFNDEQRDLEALYREVVWTDGPKLPPMPGKWVKCPTCSMIHLRSVEEESDVEWQEPFFDHRLTEHQ